MGWSLGTDTNRLEGDQDIGYGIIAECDEAGCTVEIDRGLYFVCGSNPYGEPHGCGKFFCDEHREYVYNDKDEMSPSLCAECQKRWLQENNK